MGSECWGSRSIVIIQRSHSRGHGKVFHSEAASCFRGGQFKNMFGSRSSLLFSVERKSKWRGIPGTVSIGIWCYLCPANLLSTLKFWLNLILSFALGIWNWIFFSFLPKTKPSFLSNDNESRLHFGYVSIQTPLHLVTYVLPQGAPQF